MKLVSSQIMTAAYALVCVLAIWVTAVLDGSDPMLYLVTFGVPALCGIRLGWSAAFHGIALPLYCIPAMFALGHAQVYAFYSTDVPVSVVVLIYMLFIAPTTIIAVTTGWIANRLWRMRLQANRQPDRSERV